MKHDIVWHPPGAKSRNKSLLHVDVDMDSNKSEKEVASNDFLILDLKDGWANNSQRSQRDLVILGQTPHHQPAEIGVKSWRPGYSATPGGPVGPG